MRASMHRPILLFPASLLLLLLLLLRQSHGKTLDTITQAIPLHDGDHLLSGMETTRLGSSVQEIPPTDSSGCGIKSDSQLMESENYIRHRPGFELLLIFNRFNKVTEQTVFWVANRERPINGTSGVLSIDSQGKLVLHCCNNGSSPIWSSNASISSLEIATIAQIQDTGNFILLQEQSKLVLWQSFDYPTDTLMPFMKLGLDRKTGLDRVLTSWRSNDDPRQGNFTRSMDPTGYPQLFLYKNGAPYWRGGPWTGQRWSGLPQTVNSYITNGRFINDENELTFSYELKNQSLFSRIVIEPSGLIQSSTWHDREQRWILFASIPVEQCDFYGTCGPNSNCNPYNISQFACTCLPGFEPKSPADWQLRDGSGGCVRPPGISTCERGEGFVRMARVKVLDTSQARVDMTMNLKECEQECLKNCSCKAYTSADERNGGSGCLAWYGEDLLDTRTFSDMGQDLYVRVDAATLASLSKKGDSPRKRIVIATAVACIILALLLSFTLFILKRRRESRRERSAAMASAAYLDNDQSRNMNDIKDGTEKLDLSLFDLSTVVTATNNFSFINKLGQGGFGSVYKGVLENGTEIAVKRLSKSSGQGAEEFKTEVNLIAKLQHRNLVKILGCCMEEDEKMLIYEFLPNKSLDTILFDEEKKAILDWNRRFEIAYGIARGIMYLHQDSRLRIIHRDLKASNVLLDASMSPKISDFGMARICGEDQVEGNTRRVVGTYGYMSPEYAMRGLFSVKSDVYSFGVLLLEIISGKRNSSFFQEDSSSDLIGHVWECWKGGRCLDIVDPSLGGDYPEHEVLRCIRIGLLCVQEFTMDRPTMSAVVFMLGNKVSLPTPNQPSSALNRRRDTSSSSGERTNSMNQVSLTTIEPR